MADTTTKQFIDGLIDDIWNADVPESVTNEMVARVFDYLNKGYGDLGTAINVESVDDVDGIIADGIYYLNIAGNPGNVLIVRKQTAAGSIGGTATKGVATQYLFGPTDLSFRRGSYVRSHSGNTVDWDDWVKVEQKGAGNIINVSELVPPESGSYTFATAVAAVPEVHRALGRWITYRLSSGKWETKRFAGSDLSQWENADAWEDTGGKGNITGVKVNGETLTPDASGAVNIVDYVKSIIGEIPVEHVTIKVKGDLGYRGGPIPGATVCLDIFNVKGFPAVSVPRQQLICNENGEAEFDVPHGFRYAVFSQSEGLGASFQLVFMATQESRSVNLYNFPVGVWAYGRVLVSNGDYTKDYYVPYFSDDVGDGEGSIHDTKFLEWAIDKTKGEYVDLIYSRGILVSTVGSSFVITRDYRNVNRSNGISDMDWPFNVPTITTYNRESAITDLDGNENSFKLLDFCNEPRALHYIDRMDAIDSERKFLPSIGQLYLLKLNLSNIQALGGLMDEKRWLGDGYSLSFNIFPKVDEYEAVASSTSYGGGLYDFHNDYNLGLGYEFNCYPLLLSVFYD